MKELRRLVVVVPAATLVVLLVLLYVNREAVQQLAFLRHGKGAENGLVDQRPYEGALTLAGTAVSAEEQSDAQDALRLAGHEVDQAFAMALKQSDVRQKTLTGAAEQLAQKVAALQATVKSDQAAVDALSAAAKGSGTVATPGDDLDIAQAQLGLDRDELADMQGDLARATGDQRGEIQQELTAHQAATKQAQDLGAKKTMVAAVKQYGTLLGRLEGWFSGRSRAALLSEAEEQATADAASLQKQHAALSAKLQADANTSTGLTGTDRVRMLQAMSSERAVMGILDDRAQTEQELANVYRRWQAQVWVQHSIVSYLLLRSFAWVSLIVLLSALAATFGRMAVRRTITEARHRRTLETIVLLGIEIFGLLALALVVFGTPQQMPTLFGFATAGVAVVFQDFILAFFGWFALMGKHGIRVGDWVEINAVSGEVAEISLFRTVLLETGNWTTKGHPTGRRMSFSNSFALKGAYFNFSTNGQWMWDEITLNLPTAANPLALIQQMQSAVDRETSTDSAQAEAEWQRVAKDIGVGQFGAKPTVEMRQGTGGVGVDVVVRYVTRANERFTLRSRIDAALLGVIGAAGSSAASPDTASEPSTAHNPGGA